MQEKDKNVYNNHFLSVFGDKITGGEVYNPADDQVDPRAPINDPEALYEQFVLPEDIMEELEDEKLEDFEDDIYDYEDRTELGVDIAAAAHLDYKKSKEKLKKIKKKTAENLDAVEPDDDESSAA